MHNILDKELSKLAFDDRDVVVHFRLSALSAAHFAPLPIYIVYVYIFPPTLSYQMARFVLR